MQPQPLFAADMLTASEPSREVKKWANEIGTYFKNRNTPAPILQPYRSDRGQEMLACVYSLMVITFVVTGGETVLFDMSEIAHGSTDCEVHDLVDALLMIQLLEEVRTGKSVSNVQLSTAG